MTMTTTDLRKIVWRYQKFNEDNSLDIFSREGDLEPDDRIKEGKVIIPFQGRFRNSLLSDQKICTSRFRKHGLPGQRFIAFGHVFKIRKLERWTLGVWQRNFSGRKVFHPLRSSGRSGKRSIREEITLGYSSGYTFLRRQDNAREKGKEQF